MIQIATEGGASCIIISRLLVRESHNFSLILIKRSEDELAHGTYSAWLKVKADGVWSPSEGGETSEQLFADYVTWGVHAEAEFMPKFALYSTYPGLSIWLKTLNWEKSMKEASAKGFPLITHQNIGYNLDNSHINPSKAPVVFEIR